MSQVTIIGVGLIGGSLGMALRRRGYRVVGVGRKRARLALAKRKGAIDEGTLDLIRGVQGASLVVVATPVDRIVPLVRAMWARLAPGTVVTDVGSVKTAIVREVSAAVGASAARHQGGQPVFIGGHPLAGSHQQGVEHARADLFKEATCVLTPVKGTPQATLAILQRMWRSVGARPLLLDPVQHDQWVALTSHLPHLAAAALVQSVGSHYQTDRRMARLLAGSFRDITRVAASDPGQWAAIAWGNRHAIRQAIRNFHRVLTQAERALPRQQTLRRFFQRSQAVRAALLHGR